MVVRMYVVYGCVEFRNCIIQLPTTGPSESLMRFEGKIESGDGWKGDITGTGLEDQGSG